MQRRMSLSRLVGLCVGALGMATPFGPASAQRPARPIARPPRPDRPLVPGRFHQTTEGVAGGPLPGLFTVVKVDTRAGTIELRDDGGRSGTVHVGDEVFDLDSLKAGDLLEVDFLVPEPGSKKLQAAGIWPVQR